jgi:hypothetical protein
MVRLNTVRQTARALGVPIAWLHAEARAGRVPALRVGQRLFLDPEAVGVALAERARGASATPPAPATKPKRKGRP